MSGKMILVIEDDRDIREALLEFLEMEGFSSRAAVHGEEALEILEKADTPPDLILLDLMMPRMDGQEFRKEQLRRGLHAQVPLVVMTAAAAADTKTREMSAARVLRKPVDLVQLIDVLQELCGTGGR